MTLAYIWYSVVVLAMICYAMLDGFDLGVGLLHPFAKNDQERRIFLNSIGPVWDGNKVISLNVWIFHRRDGFCI
jgi:cytochrome d ubiquinol oxidase subunit II